MKQFSRDTLIKALIKENPSTDPVWYEAMTDEDLQTEFQSCANQHSDQIRQYREIQLSNR